MYLLVHVAVVSTAYASVDSLSSNICFSMFAILANFLCDIQLYNNSWELWWSHACQWHCGQIERFSLLYMCTVVCTLQFCLHVTGNLVQISSQTKNKEKDRPIGKNWFLIHLTQVDFENQYLQRHKTAKSAVAPMRGCLLYTGCI